MDLAKIRRDFPILQRQINGKPLVYLDNAATSQKPRQVIEAIVDYYQNHNANVHRGLHTLGDEATRLYSESRQAVAEFIGAEPEELIFTRNTTEAINLVAYSWGMASMGKGDVMVTTEMEHHSNIVPWQEVARRVGARVEYVRVDEQGELDLDDLDKKLKLKPKLVAVTQVSNFLGTVNPIKEIASKCKGIKVIVDGAQAVPHMRVDVKKLGVDFYAFSGHKMYGPMGIGCLWVRKEILETMQPWLTGGGMISEVAITGTKFAELPDRWDAGTPDVAGAVGLAAAVKYLQQVGMGEIEAYEKQLVDQVIKGLGELGGVRIYGSTDINKRGSLVAFTLDGIHAHDVAQILDSEGVAARSGHHCTMPMHTKLNLAATTRVSFGLYNTEAEIAVLIQALQKVKKVFHG